MSTSRSGTCDLHQVDSAAAADAGELATLAAQTFPLACPPAVAPEHVAAFVDSHLSPARFAEYLADPQREILAARLDGRIIGYAMLIRGAPDGPVELSKLYTHPDFHGTGVSAALMHTALVRAAAWGAHQVWLGVNQQNQRAQRFYAKSGFEVSGTRTFRLGPHLENDYVMTRAVG
ncbi:GNAT family N-acetyltransferase [Mycobacterium sp. 23]|uniref:GNAT family N-acetyltransferase n=1 Tax=Mycobacterium sp. 23 TaxID=3400424 RepID=UPI003AB09AF9